MGVYKLKYYSFLFSSNWKRNLENFVTLPHTIRHRLWYYLLGEIRQHIGRLKLRFFLILFFIRSDNWVVNNLIYIYIYIYIFIYIYTYGHHLTQMSKLISLDQTMLYNNYSLLSLLFNVKFFSCISNKSGAAPHRAPGGPRTTLTWKKKIYVIIKYFLFIYP